jgi:glyceraldehyde 3-phosphate dehydrogenase
VWRDEEGLSSISKSKGVAKVILTAPGKGDLKNIVAGINNDIIEPEDRILRGVVHHQRHRAAPEGHRR